LVSLATQNSTAMKNTLVRSISVILVVFGIAVIGARAVSHFRQDHPKSKVKKAASAFDDLMPGDIIFQSGNSPQCEAVKLATHSPYSHCGIIFQKKGEWVVYEGVQPVSITPLKTWIKHGTDGKYSIKRLNDAATALTPTMIEKMQKYAEGFIGRNYDIYFGWSDETIYCSELVWKVYYQGAGIEVGKLKTLKEFDLDHPAVKAIMEERYGKNIPWKEKVIAPSDIFNCERLVEVALNEP
jgi:hypothetical protein